MPKEPVRDRAILETIQTINVLINRHYRLMSAGDGTHDFECIWCGTRFTRGEITVKYKGTVYPNGTVKRNAMPAYDLLDHIEYAHNQNR